MAKKTSYKEENLFNYLKAKLFVKGVKDNGLSAKQIYQYVTKHFKAKV